MPKSAAFALSPTKCDQEPIHIPGSIQPHGVLLTVHPDTATILQAAGNTKRIMGRAVSELVDQDIEAVLGTDVADLVRSSLHDSFSEPLYLGSFTLFGRPSQLLDVTTHTSDSVLVLELEPSPACPDSAAQMLAKVGRINAELESAPDLNRLFQAASREVRRLTAFDRVMIYRFREDGAGSVVAEDKVEDLAPLLHHHYPASDIPRQARALYLQNPIRVIPDAGFTPAPLVPALNPASGKPLDMSGCALRSVSPIHVQYLKNMGVAASMSVSLIADGTLWGLIACHHKVPKLVPYELREACKHLGQILSQQIKAGEEAELHLQASRLGIASDELLQGLAKAPSVGKNLLDHIGGVACLLPADGMAIVYGENVGRIGHAPEDEQVRKLVGWLLGSSLSGAYATNNLAGQYGPAKDYAAQASGLLATVVSFEERIVLLWFRAEHIEIINWAGDPHEPVEAGEKLGALTPRRSFEVWKETVRHRSRPWSFAEVDAAQRFGRTVSELCQQNKLHAQNEELQEARSAAERANLAKSQFLAAMSHEIRTPMTSVLGMADLLVSDDLTPTQQRYVQTIRTSGSHLLSIINDILDFSRIEAGRLDLERIDFAPLDILEQTRSLLMPQANERGLDLRIDTSTQPLLVVKGDPTRLQQILVNLTGNALKFTAKGQVVVALREQALASDQTLLRFEVRDTGIGISAERQAQLFEAFVQADSSIARHYGGSGLGLAICRRLVTAMNGTIGVVSEPGQGSIFWFELPMSLGDPQKVALRSLERQESTQPLRVLVVDDVAANRELLSEMLRRSGHAVEQAENGAQAVTAAGRNTFDAVLMDVQMPVMDGIEATRRIRQLPSPMKDVPIFALTANVMESEPKRCLTAGMNVCLTKPIIWGELFAALAGVLPNNVDRPTSILAAAPVAAAAPIGMPGEEPPLLNLALISGMASKLPATVVQEMLTRGLTGAQESYERLRAALGDPEVMAEEAHRLRGTAGIFGLARISALAGDIDDLLRDRQQFQSLVDQLEEAVQATQAAIIQVPKR